jgi:hypothetical protein
MMVKMLRITLKGMMVVDYKVVVSSTDHLKVVGCCAIIYLIR